MEAVALSCDFFATTGGCLQNGPIDFGPKVCGCGIIEPPRTWGLAGTCSDPCVTFRLVVVSLWALESRPFFVPGYCTCGRCEIMCARGRAQTISFQPQLCGATGIYGTKPPPPPPVPRRGGQRCHPRGPASSEVTRAQQAH